MTDIVTRLRAHPSRDNRALLDEAANAIERVRLNLETALEIEQLTARCKQLEGNLDAMRSMYEDAERSVARLADEIANHKHAEDAYITIIDKLKRRIEHECVAWHPASEWPERDEWVIAAIDGYSDGRTYYQCIAQAWVDWEKGHYYNEDGDDITDIVKWWCYEPEWPEEDEDEQIH